MADTLLIAKRLKLAKQRLDDLLEQETNNDRCRALLQKRAALDREVMRLISINIRSSGQEYDDATAAVADANRELGRAIQDIENFTKAMEMVASAISAVSKIKPV